MLRLQKAILRLTMSILAILIVVSNNQTGTAQPVVFRMGVEPGTQVNIPQDEPPVFGPELQPGQPTVVLFYRFTPCDLCEIVHEIAQSWQTRYPNVQVAVVSRSSVPAELREFALSQGTRFTLFADTHDSWMETFDNTIRPVAYLLDRSGVVQAKLIGSDWDRFVAFDALVDHAQQNRWDIVRSLAGRSLELGQAPPPMAGLSVSSSRPTVVYHHNPLCDICQEMHEQGLVTFLNGIARKYPSANFVVFEPILSERITIRLGPFVDTFGLQALPEFLRNDIAADLRTPLPPTLPRGGWEANIEFVRYDAGTPNDPGWQWGQAAYPALMLFSSRGTYEGPAPFWQGPFTVSSLIMTMDAFLQDATP